MVLSLATRSGLGRLGPLGAFVAVASSHLRGVWAGTCRSPPPTLRAPVQHVIAVSVRAAGAQARWPDPW
jgi:hypothetical protein